MTTNTFETAYMCAFAELSRAREYHERNNRRRELCFHDISPENFAKTFFHGRLPEASRNFVKLIYDAGLPGDNIVVGLLRSAQAHLKIGKILKDGDVELAYICDFKKTKTMFVPTDTENYLKLFHYVCALCESHLLSHEFVKQHKRLKQKTHMQGDSTLNNLRRAISSGNEALIGRFAATLVWILHSRNMTIVQTSSMLRTGLSISNNTSFSSRLLKSLPAAKPVPIAPVAPVAEKPQEPTKLQAEDHEVPDDWEDVDLDF